MAGAHRWCFAGEEDGAAAKHDGQRRTAPIAGSLGRLGDHEVREKRRRPPRRRTRRCAGGVLTANLMQEVYRKGKRKKKKQIK
jgi:hypothetical protein